MRAADPMAVVFFGKIIPRLAIRELKLARIAGSSSSGSGSSPNRNDAGCDTTEYPGHQTDSAAARHQWSSDRFRLRFTGSLAPVHPTVVTQVSIHAELASRARTIAPYDECPCSDTDFPQHPTPSSSIFCACSCKILITVIACWSTMQ